MTCLHPSVVPDPTSFWDVATAIGTVLAAFATVAAVVGALKVAKDDRRAAERIAKDDRAAAEAAVEQQLEAQRMDRLREHHVDLLLRLVEQIGIHRSHGGMPQQHEAIAVGSGVLMALPDSLLTDLPATRAMLGSGLTWEDLPAYAPRGRPNNEQLYLDALNELGVVIQETAGRP